MKERSFFTQLIKIINIRPKPLIIALFIWLGTIIILLAFHFPRWFWLIVANTQWLLLIWVGWSIFYHAELPTINKPITGKFAKAVGILIIISGLYTVIGYKIVQFIYGIK
jgi:hypothetical protein